MNPSHISNVSNPNFTFQDFDALLEDCLEPAVVLAGVVKDGDVAGLDGPLQMSNHVAVAAFKATTTNKLHFQLDYFVCVDIVMVS